MRQLDKALQEEKRLTFRLDGGDLFCDVRGGDWYFKSAFVTDKEMERFHVWLGELFKSVPAEEAHHG